MSEYKYEEDKSAKKERVYIQKTRMKGRTRQKPISIAHTGSSREITCQMKENKIKALLK